MLFRLTFRGSARPCEFQLLVAVIYATASMPPLNGISGGVQIADVDFPGFRGHVSLRLTGSLIGFRADAAQVGVSTHWIVERIDVFGDLGSSNVPVLVDLLLDGLLLQTAEEGLGNGIVPAVAPSAHARDQFVGAAGALPVIASVLRSLIRMDDRLAGMTTSHCHHDGTSSRPIVAATTHPTIFRENRSMTTARYSQPSQVRM